MSYDLSGLVPFLIGFFVLAGASALLAVATLTTALAGHRRVRLVRHESIPTYYRHVLAH